MSQIRSMQSCATDARQAAREFHDGVIQPDTEHRARAFEQLVFYFECGGMN